MSAAPPAALIEDAIGLGQAARGARQRDCGAVDGPHILCGYAAGGDDASGEDGTNVLTRCMTPGTLERSQEYDT